jgi:hypothetical protein
MCAPTDEEARELAAGWTFFIFALGYYGRKGVDAPGTSDLWSEYQAWRKTDKAQDAINSALVGSPETIRKKLRQYAGSHVDQVILLNQAGRNTHEDICSSLELFASEVMPEFVGRDSAHQQWKQAVLAGETVLEEVDTSPDVLARPQRKPIETSALGKGLTGRDRPNIGRCALPWLASDCRHAPCRCWVRNHLL